MEHRTDPTTGERLGYHIDAEVVAYSVARPPVCMGVLREDVKSIPQIVYESMAWPEIIRIKIENKRSGEMLVMIRDAA